MKYFLHDTSAFDDEKVSELFIKFGYEGLGLFFTVLEKLAKQEKPIKTEVLKKQLRVGKKLQKCWNFMEEIELISSNNGETFNKQLLNFSEKYAIKKEKNAKRISEWRKNQEDTENVTRYEQLCNTPKVNEIEVNEIDSIIPKKPKKEVIKPTIEEVKKYFDENGYTTDSALKMFNYYDVANWTDSKGNKILNWKQKAQAVWFKEENKKPVIYIQPKNTFTLGVSEEEKQRILAEG